MSFAYTRQPLTVLEDEVRFLLGDTVDAKHLIEDEEIAYALDKENNRAHRAAARLLRQKISHAYARLGPSRVHFHRCLASASCGLSPTAER